MTTWFERYAANRRANPIPSQRRRQVAVLQIWVGLLFGFGGPIAGYSSSAAYDLVWYVASLLGFVVMMHGQWNIGERYNVLGAGWPWKWMLKMNPSLSFDERDLQLRAWALSVSFAVTNALIYAVAVVTWSLSSLKLWTPSSVQFFMMLMLLFSLTLQLPSSLLAWSEPDAAEDA